MQWVEKQFYLESVNSTEDNTGFDKIVLILFILIVGYLGISLMFDQPISRILSNNPDKSCRVDSDCVLRVTTCHTCTCEAVTNDWKPLCLVKSAANECKPCESIDSKSEVKCLENLCQKI